ncbi:hypothetical protein [Legionella bozemanae]|uniref:hypothetical protein n=1 Tax=Legionella bozemanae TaxID=447 RepID=UPI00399CC226
MKQKTSAEHTKKKSLSQQEVTQLRSDALGENGKLRQQSAGKKLEEYLFGEDIPFQIRKQALWVAKEKIKAQPHDEITKALAKAESSIHRQDVTKEVEEGFFNKKKKTVVTHKKSEDMVIQVFDLITALNNYNGKISIGNNLARLNTAAQLGKALTEYATSTDKDKKTQFIERCTNIMTENYQALAAEASLWNAIKELVKPLLEKLNIDTKRLYSSSEVIKNKEVQQGFKDLIKQGVTIKTEDTVDTDLKKGP